MYRRESAIRDRRDLLDAFHPGRELPRIDPVYPPGNLEHAETAAARYQLGLQPVVAPEPCPMDVMRARPRLGRRESLHARRYPRGAAGRKECW